MVPGGIIKVRVKEQADGNISGRVVHVSSKDGTEICRLRQDLWGILPPGCQLKSTDQGGTTAVEGLHPGTYKVSVEGIEGTVEATVKALETVTVTL